METLTIIYIGTMFLLGVAASNIIYKKSDKIIQKKRFKHYRFN